jgi:hypothetical protein
VKRRDAQQPEEFSLRRSPFGVVSPRQEHREHDLRVNDHAQLGGFFCCRFTLFVHLRDAFRFGEVLALRRAVRVASPTSDSSSSSFVSGASVPSARYAPEINKRMRPHLKMSGISYRIDETYVKVGKVWKYLYRAVDKMALQSNSCSARNAMFARQNASLRS